jgi:sugar/nucleoside kinase (ribokinase family)
MIPNLLKKNKKLIVGVGSALVDILAHEDNGFLGRTDAIKGGMIYVSKDDLDHIFSLMSGEYHIVPGGSACNTAIGIGKLGGQARFVGKCGKDDMATLIETDLINNKVEPTLFRSTSPTGRVLSIITPDAQRSMFTFLGASSETQPGEITKKCFENAAIVHIEGYLLFNEDLIMATVKAAKAADAYISLDLASFTVVEKSKKLLEIIVKDFVDILIANEDEAYAFTGDSNELKALNRMSKHVHMAAIKLGERGSHISYINKVINVEPKGPVHAIDTTGAGDLWASGFLFGLANGYSLEKSGELGSACGYEVCKVIGAKIPDEGWIKIGKLLEA